MAIEALSRVGVNQPRCDVDHLSPFRVEVKNKWSSTPPVGADREGKRQLSLTQSAHASALDYNPSGVRIKKYGRILF